MFRNFIINIISLLLIFVFAPVHSWSQNNDQDVNQEVVQEIKQEALELPESIAEEDEVDDDLVKDDNNNEKDIFIKIDELLAGKEKFKSLMYDDEEYKDINRALDSFNNDQAFIVEDSESESKKKKKVEKKVEEKIQSYVYLNSILYFGNDQWSIWINGDKISSDINDVNKEFYIKSINSKSVDITWRLSISKWKILSGKKSEEDAPNIIDNAVEIHFTLKPNQTYVLLTNKVIEGRVF